MFFKETDRNCYVPIQSCHHLKWLKAIPNMQIRRICDNLEDFHTQSEILTNQFIEKGYSHRELTSCKNQVLPWKGTLKGDMAFVEIKINKKLAYPP